MKIFLTESEVIELAYSALDMMRPNPDKVHDIALKMDMVYDEHLDMYEDVEEVSLRKLKQKSIGNYPLPEVEELLDAIMFARVWDDDHPELENDPDKHLAKWEGRLRDLTNRPFTKRSFTKS
jgi:hypothetical protein